jgi:hypothetical protein
LLDVMFCIDRDLPILRLQWAVAFILFYTGQYHPGLLSLTRLSEKTLYQYSTN